MKGSIAAFKKSRSPSSSFWSQSSSLTPSESNPTSLQKKKSKQWPNTSMKKKESFTFSSSESSWSCSLYLLLSYHLLLTYSNAGIEGPVTHLGPDPKSLSAKKLSEMHLSNESTEDWTNVFKTNTTSLFFCSMAMLPLLEKGNESPPKGKKSGKGGWSGTIINITSISGVVKMAQDVSRRKRLKMLKQP